MDKKELCKVMHAKAGCTDTLSQELSNGMYPEDIELYSDTTADIDGENKKIFLEPFEITPVISYGISMVEAGIDNHCLVFLKKNDISDLEKGTVIGIKMESKCKLRLLDRVENNKIFVNKFEFDKNKGCFYITPSLKTHIFDDYIGYNVKNLSLEKTKEFIKKNSYKISTTTEEVDGIWETTLSFPDDFKITKKQKNLLMSITKSYSESKEESKEEFMEEMKHRIKRNENSQSNNIISKTLTKLEFYI